MICTQKIEVKQLLPKEIEAPPIQSKESLLYLINNAQTVEDKILTLGEANLVKLSDEEKQIAINKGGHYREKIYRKQYAANKS